MKYTIECFVKKGDEYWLTVEDSFFIIKPDINRIFYTVYSSTPKPKLYQNDYTIKQALTFINSLISIHIEINNQRSSEDFTERPELLVNGYEAYKLMRTYEDI